MLLLLIFNISSLFAQGQAFTKHPVTKEEYANAVENCDKSILRIDCGKLVQAVQNAWPELKIRDKYDLADYIRSLVEIPGPVGPAKFSRVYKNGTVDFNWTRDIKEGEILLFDNNRAEFKFSLSCGNMTFGIPVLGVFKKSEEKAVEKKKEEVVKKSLAELKIELNYYDNSKNTFISNTSIPDSPFNPFHITNLLWEVPVMGLVVWVIIKLLSSGETQKSFSSGGILPPN